MASDILNPGFDSKPDLDRHVFLERLKSEDNPFLSRLVANLTIRDQIGNGDQKIAYGLDEETVLLVFNQGLDEHSIREEFYERKLMHSLFPHLVPDVHLGIFPERVLVVRRVYEHFRALGFSYDQFDNARNDTVNKFADFGMPVDEVLVNFAINPFAEAVYLDSSPHQYWDMDRLTTGLDFLPDDQARVAYGYLSRIMSSELVA